jgi:hypothetical protein
MHYCGVVCLITYIIAYIIRNEKKFFIRELYLLNSRGENVNGQKQNASN